MRQFIQITLGVLGLTMISCRTATRVAEVPRVDLELEGGNRGFLVGHPTEAARLKSTRQTVQTDIEISSVGKPQQPGSAVAVQPGAPAEPKPAQETAASPETPEPASAAPTASEAYTVKKGESLWSIAAKPTVYGTATRWRQLFDANRDVLKTPDGLRAGMTIKIPRASGQGAEAASGTEGRTTFKK